MCFFFSFLTVQNVSFLAKDMQSNLHTSHIEGTEPQLVSYIYLFGMQKPAYAAFWMEFKSRKLLFVALMDVLRRPARGCAWFPLFIHDSTHTLGQDIKKISLEGHFISQANSCAPTHLNQLSSAPTRAMQGLCTFFAASGCCLSSHSGSQTRKKSRGFSFSR
jgi:hypothetical protein